MNKEERIELAKKLINEEINRTLEMWEGEDLLTYAWGWRNEETKNMNTIRLQVIDEYLYPTDSWSRDTLFDETNHDRFKKDMLDLLAPRLVKKGYKLAISNYI